MSSLVHGIGLFADENVSTGTIIWKFVLGFDQVFTADELLRLPREAQIFLCRHAYKSKRTGRYILDTDDGRYFNHADSPNSSTISQQHDGEDTIIATRDIKKGEEITIDYSGQEETGASDNVLWDFYKKYGLKDELDPRIKRPVY